MAMRPKEEIEAELAALLVDEELAQEDKQAAN